MLPDDRTGSRRYQVMLKSIKVLPNMSITAKTLSNYRSDTKGKHKAVEEPRGSTASKKRFTGREHQDEVKVEASDEEARDMEVSDN